MPAITLVNEYSIKLNLLIKPNGLYKKRATQFIPNGIAKICI